MFSRSTLISDKSWIPEPCGASSIPNYTHVHNSILYTDMTYSKFNLFAELPARLSAQCART